MLSCNIKSDKLEYCAILIGQTVRTYNADTGVSKSTVRLSIAIVDLVLGIVLSAIVVRELNETLAIPDDIAMGQSIWRVVSQEVQVKLGIGEFQLLNDGHAEMFIKLDGRLGVFYSNPVIERM